MSVVSGLTLTPIEAMRLAIVEAEKGWGNVSPNPLVGCVIVDKDQRLIAVGHHAEYGGPHAEAMALASIEDKSVLKGATVYVTLEPCSHKGKTGSCALALIEYPIAKVIYGLIDPNPLVAGKGIKVLEGAEIKTELATASGALGPGAPAGAAAELAADLERLCEHFLWNQRHKKPFIALKAATTLDGMIASPEGESKWISNEDSRLETHRLRAGFDALLVGKNTFITDNPGLDARHPLAKRINNVIVLDTKGEGLAKLKASQLQKVRPPKNIYWVVNRPERLRDTADDLGINLIQGPIEDAMDALMAAGIFSILVEGGAAVHSHFIEKRLAQRLYLFIAPQIAGGAGIHWTQKFLPGGWDQRRKLRDVKIRAIKDDMYWTGRLD